MSYTDSDPFEGGPLALQGVWIHDPVDPQGTVRQFLYGKAIRTSDVDILGTAQRFAGREAPVVDYGEHTDRSYQVTVQVPEDTDHQAYVGYLTEFAEVKRTLVLRDNRGRVLFGVMSGFRVGDAEWGSAVAFTFTEVDVAVEEVAA